MLSESDDGESADPNLDWEIQKTVRKRTRDNYTTEELCQIIGSTPTETDRMEQKKKKKGTSQKHTQETITQDKQISQPEPATSQSNLEKLPQEQYINTKTLPTNHTRNFSAKMLEITNKKFTSLFYLNPSKSLTRLQMSDLWEEKFPHAEDVIIKTTKGFLLKTNTQKTAIIEYVKTLVEKNILESFTETTPYTKTARAAPADSYCCVINSVEFEIDDAKISEHLINTNIQHRYCKRIISKKTNRPTSFIRVITGSIAAYEALLNHGMFYKNRHYAVYTATPPPPLPLPCAKCQQYTHQTMDCKTPTKCSKCGGNHQDNKCTSHLPPKCLACQSESHSAWSTKCPKRPTKPIEGIPNVPIRSVNKKSLDIDTKTTKNNKIHTPITIHDHIINTYMDKLNSPKHPNRNELLLKLKKKFIRDYNIDTVPVFSYNRVYIVMFDLNEPGSISPTEPTTGSTQYQIHT